MNKKFLTLGVAIIVIGVIMYSLLNSKSGNNLNAFMEENQLSFDSNEELVEYLEYSTDKASQLNAQIFPRKIVFKDNKKSVEWPLNDDLFYLSFAPYLDQTHPCTFHVPTGCQGELPKRKFDVKITNNDTGEIIYDSEVETATNGFAGVWIPRNIDGTLEVSYYGQKAIEIFQTTDESPTCLTTLKLI